MDMEQVKAAAAAKLQFEVIKKGTYEYPVLPGPEIKNKKTKQTTMIR
jgi:hypothetical protein